MEILNVVILNVVFTLDVLKLSGWLNFTALQNTPPMSVTLDVLKSSGWLNSIASENILLMSVTLDVSKLSGWFNASTK